MAVTISPTGDFGYFWWLLLVISSELSLWYRFFTQNLTLYKFYFWVFAKFHQLAILAIFGDFWWLLLVMSSEWSLWYQFFTQNLTLYMFLQFDLKILARKFEQSQVGLTGLINSQISQISAYFFVILLSLHLHFCKRIKWFGPKVIAISWCLHIF